MENTPPEQAPQPQQPVPTPAPMPTPRPKPSAGGLIGLVLAILAFAFILPSYFGSPLLYAAAVAIPLLFFPAGYRLIYALFGIELSWGTRIIGGLLILMAIFIGVKYLAPDSTAPSLSKEEGAYIMALAPILKDIEAAHAGGSAAIASQQDVNQKAIDIATYRDQYAALVTRLDTLIPPTKFAHFHTQLLASVIGFRDGFQGIYYILTTGDDSGYDQLKATLKTAEDQLAAARQELLTLLPPAK